MVPHTPSLQHLLSTPCIRLLPVLQPPPLQQHVMSLHEAVELPDRDASLAAIWAALDAGQDVHARDSRGWSPLELAVRTDAETVKAAVAALVEAGANVRAKTRFGEEPLHVAAQNPNAEAAAVGMKALVAAGADVRTNANHGAEPLHAAAQNPTAEAAAAAVAALVSAGADVRAKDNHGFEPLSYAVCNTHAEAAAATVAALIEAGADLNCSAYDGSRPLHVAHHLDTALLLVRLGASLSLRDNAGRTTLEAAAGGSSSDMAALRQASISGRRCAGCGAGGERLKRCIRCRTVSYCK